MNEWVRDKCNTHLSCLMEERRRNCHFADLITDTRVNTKPIAVPVAARPNKPTSTTLITASGEGQTHVSASH